MKWLFLFSAVFFACQKPQERPSLSDEQIARVMADLFIAEAATSGLSGFEKDSLAQVYYTQVMEMHHLTVETYERELHLRAGDGQRMLALTRQAEELLKPTIKK